MRLRSLSLGSCVSLLFIACPGRQGRDPGPTEIPKQDADPRRPSWWADPTADNLHWPPPRPDGWAEDEPWPPLREVGEDPEFWTELYGDDIDAESDERLDRPGTDGNPRFREIFERRIRPGQDDDMAPGCGFHRIYRQASRDRETCVPYPAAEIRALCAEVLDPDAVADQCRDHCLRNGQRCLRSRVLRPAVWTNWECVTIPEEVDRGDDPPAFSKCEAEFVCDCHET